MREVIRQLVASRRTGPYGRAARLTAEARRVRSLSEPQLVDAAPNAPKPWPRAEDVRREPVLERRTVKLAAKDSAHTRVDLQQRHGPAGQAEGISGEAEQLRSSWLRQPRGNRQSLTAQERRADRGHTEQRRLICCSGARECPVQFLRVGLEPLPRDPQRLTRGGRPGSCAGCRPRSFESAVVNGFRDLLVRVTER